MPSVYFFIEFLGFRTEVIIDQQYIKVENEMHKFEFQFDDGFSASK